MNIEQEAVTLGWTPKDQFKGDPDKWVDAEEFVERGKHIMPILRKNNEKLLGTVDALQGKIVALETAVAESLESMEALKEFHASATKAEVTKARREILENLRNAKTEGDVDAEIQATADLSAFDAAQLKSVAEKPPAGKAKAPAAGPAPEVVAPEVQAWMDENKWYGVDQERTGMAIGVANRLRAEGNKTTGRPFLELVASVVDERLGTGEMRTPDNKVEGGSRGGSGGGKGGARGGTGYENLPADAREKCDQQAAKFVGPTRAFKTTKEWNTYYATQYFKGN